MKPHPVLFAAPFAALAIAASAQTVTVFNETFPAGGRTTLSVPDSAAWFSSSGSSTVTYTSDTSIELATGSSGRHLLGYFTADGSPVSLALGETLQVTFQAQFDTTTAFASGSNNLRVGLFDSTNGTRISADNLGGTSAANGGPLFDNYTGYIATMNAGGTKNGLRLYERTSTTNQALIAGIDAYTQLGASVDAPTALNPGTVYTGTFTFSRTASQELTISFFLTGGGLSNYSITEIDSSPTFTFDTFAIYATSNTMDSMTLFQLKVEKTSAIPEPATYAALVGLAVVGFAGWHRRRAR